jgi:hypothetical protein
MTLIIIGLPGTVLRLNYLIGVDLWGSLKSLDGGHGAYTALRLLSP